MRYSKPALALAFTLLSSQAFADEAALAAMCKSLSLYMGIPFAGLLLSIALFPLLAPDFWSKHFGKVAAFWGVAVAIPFLVQFKGDALHEIAYVYAADYLPFMVLLWSLYTVAGGIVVSGSIVGSPLANVIMIALGAFLASFVGTTGASMLMIRPFLLANNWRKHRAHQVVFFIFLVSNIGGALTPLGDPPLFLGFLHGVPFFWTLKLIGPALLVSALLLTAFFLIDSHYYRGEHNRPLHDHTRRVKILGKRNFAYVGVIVAAIFLSGVVKLGYVEIFGIHRPVADLLRDGVLIAMGLISLKTTDGEYRRKNNFTWHAIEEVAILFAGIFITMIPVLLILKAGKDGHMAILIESVKEPAHYFWASGVLSSFLDNAPTYLVFLNTALGNFCAGMPEPEAIKQLIAQNPLYLMAISAGSVFMGANSYIGNAPNFMVRSIAEEYGVEMPSFFGYIFKYSLVFLIPSFIVVTFVFF